MKLVSEIFHFLNKNKIIYAVLRNHEDLPEIISSRDIDILIRKKDFKNQLNNIIKIICDLNFKIITYYRNDRIYTLVCSKIEGDVELIQFDFFFQSSVYGINLIDSNDILEKRLFNGKIFFVIPEYQFLDKYLYLKFLGIEYPIKYKNLKDSLQNSEFINGYLRQCFNCNNIDDLISLPIITYRRKVLKNSLLKNSFKQLSMSFLFLFYYFNNLFNYKGFSLGFTGPDGAGKTTIINDIINDLSKVYSSVNSYHFRPNLLPNLGEAAYKTKLKAEVDKDYSNPHRGEKTNVISSVLRLCYYSLDYIIGYYSAIRPKLIKRCVVIFDRYYSDIIVDSRRSRIYLNHKLLYVFGKFFIPKLDYNILLTADENLILLRKQELTKESIVRINKSLDFLSDKKGYYLIKNNDSPEIAKSKILKTIFSIQHKNNISKLSR